MYYWAEEVYQKRSNFGIRIRETVEFHIDVKHALKTTNNFWPILQDNGHLPKRK